MEEKLELWQRYKWFCDQYLDIKLSFTLPFAIQVAAQIVEYYKSAQKILMLGNKNFDGNPVAEVVGSKIFKSWKKFCEFKLSYHQCVSLLYMGINCEELQKMGDRVAYYQVLLPY